MTVDSSTEHQTLLPQDTSYTLRQVKPSDLLALRQDCWAHRPIIACKEILQRIDLANKRQRGLGIIAETINSERVIAYGQILSLSKCSEISDLIVSKNYQSQGIGAAMIQYLIISLPERANKIIEIGVAESNPRALALYQRLGFEKAYDLKLNLNSEHVTVFYLRLKIPITDSQINSE